MCHSSLELQPERKPVLPCTWSKVAHFLTWQHVTAKVMVKDLTRRPDLHEASLTVAAAWVMARSDQCRPDHLTPEHLQQPEPLKQ